MDWVAVWSQIASWPWQQIGLIAGAIAAILGMIVAARNLLNHRPRDEAHARRVISHLLRTGPPKRPYSSFKGKLREASDAQLRSLLMEFGATSTTHPITRIEMMGLPSRGS